jgi:hypothetical protein
LGSPLSTAVLQLAALAPAMLLLGATLFALYAPDAAEDLPRALALGAAVLLLAAVAARITDAALALSDPADPQPLAATLRDLLLETGFGRAWGAQLVLAALLLAALLARSSSCRQPPASPPRPGSATPLPARAPRARRGSPAWRSTSWPPAPGSAAWCRSA